MKSGTRSSVLLSGYFGCGNLGDDLLLIVASERLRGVLPDARFLVRDHGDRTGADALGANVVFTGVEAILSDRRRSKLSRFIGYLVAIGGLLRQCRWLVFAGGTVFHDRGGVRSLFLQWSTVLLARLMGVRSAALGVGVADLNSPMARRLMRSIVGMSALFLVRDEAALRQCAGTSARLTDDIVFAWAALPKLKSLPQASSPKASRAATIAITVCPGALSPADEARAITALANAIRLWRSHGHRVVSMIFLRTGVTTGDDAMLSRIDASLDFGDAVERRQPHANPEAIAAAFHDVDLVCGMRFHALVLAATFTLPFVGLAHENKISEICRRFDMTCLDARTFDGIALATAAEAALARRPDAELVEASIAAATRNFSEFALVAQ